MCRVAACLLALQHSGDVAVAPAAARVRAQTRRPRSEYLAIMQQRGSPE
jgi:hypothetical protein